MKLVILLESLKVRDLTNSVEQIVKVAQEKAEQTRQGPEYFNQFKKMFWNTIKAMLKIEFNITIMLTKRTDSQAHTNLNNPLTIYLSNNFIERSTNYLSSVYQRYKILGTKGIVTTLVHEITHLKQFSKLSNSLTSVDNLYDESIPHHERHWEIEAHCNQIWGIVKDKLQSKNGNIDFNIGIIHNCLYSFFDRYNIDFNQIPEPVKKQYYKKLYKVFTTDTGIMPSNSIKNGDIVMIYSDPIEDTPLYPVKYVVVDIDGYKVTVNRVVYNYDTSELEPTGPDILVNRMFVAHYSMLKHDMFDKGDYLK